MIEVNFKPELAEQLKAGFGQNLIGTRAFAGCEEASALVDQDDPNRVVVLMQWESRSSYEAYLQMRSDVGGMDRINAVSTKPYRITYYDYIRA